MPSRGRLWLRPVCRVVMWGRLVDGRVGYPQSSSPPLGGSADDSPALMEQYAMRNRRNTNVRNAFTLIEILIVVVILGILAAIVVPQFTNAADDANDASVRSQLQTLRSQVELYRAQNPTTNPVAADGTPVWTNMIDGDYLTTAPINPLTGNTTIGTAAAADGSVAWIWRVKTGGSTSYSLYAADPSEGSPFEFVE